MTTITTEFNYEAFDRQMEALLQMSMVLIRGWDDYAAQELTFDIRSLCVKGSRLCSLADQDLALQQADLTHARRQANQYFYVQLNELVTKQLSPLMTRVVDDIRNKKRMEFVRINSAANQVFDDLRPVLDDYWDNIEKTAMGVINNYSMTSDDFKRDKLKLVTVKLTDKIKELRNE